MSATATKARPEPTTPAAALAAPSTPPPSNPQPPRGWPRPRRQP